MIFGYDCWTRLAELFDTQREGSPEYEKWKKHHRVDSISYMPREGSASLHRSSLLDESVLGKLPDIYRSVFPGTPLGVLKKSEAKAVIQQVNFTFF
jgi:hypothetical protein